MSKCGVTVFGETPISPMFVDFLKDEPLGTHQAAVALGKSFASKHAGFQKLQKSNTKLSTIFKEQNP